MSNLTKKLSNSRVAACVLGVCVGTAIGITAAEYVLDADSEKTDFRSSWYVQEESYYGPESPDLPEVSELVGMSITIPAGGHVWGQVNDFVAQETEFLCVTPQEHEFEVLSLVRRLELQEGRSLNLVFPGDKLTLREPVEWKSEYFCPPPVPKSSNREEYAHEDGAPLVPSQSADLTPPGAPVPGILAPGAIETPRQAPPKENPGTGDVDPDFLPR